MNSSCHGRKQAADVRKHAGSDARDPSPATMRSYMVAEIQAVVQKILGIVIMLTTSAGRDCNVAHRAS